VRRVITGGGGRGAVAFPKEKALPIIPAKCAIGKELFLDPVKKVRTSISLL